MKQKITIKLQMDSDKCRNKALGIAAEVEGVSSASIEGNEKDRVVVVGEDVDTICLCKLLKKKFRCVIVLTVEEVKPKPPEKKEEKPPCCTTLCIVPVDPCFKCRSSKCEGKCQSCSNCHSHKCDGKCEPCSKCQSHKCRGQCSTTTCYGRCPPGNPCSSCRIAIKCLPPPPPPPPCTTSGDPCYYRVAYDPYQGSCSIQ